MSHFEKILIPVDFTVNTTVAVAKAAELAVTGLTTIELVHAAETKEPGWAKLLGLAATVRKDHGINAEPHLLVSQKVETAIIRFATNSNPGLIVIGKHNYHSFFPFLNTVVSANIAAQTKCPVLTVKPGSLKKRMEKVVMPLSEGFSQRKIDLLVSLNRNLNLTVHLLTILDNHQHPDSHSASALLQSIKCIREKLKCHVQHSVIHSNNKAIATLHYAQKINADILLVSPEAESTITTWMTKKNVADNVSPASQLQVLSIQPN